MGQFSKIVSSQRAFFKTSATRPLEKRKELLVNLSKMVNDHLDDVVVAYRKDLGRGRGAALFEKANVDARIAYTIDNLEAWAAPTPLPVVAPLNKEEDDLVLVKESLGVVLNIAPWNGPLTSMASNMYPLAAGNTVIFKPSELAPAIASLWSRIVPLYFDPNVLTVVTGGVPETTELLTERFDHIFYTGSTGVAKIIMGAAAKNLTPVTLELGGKNPVFIDDTADIPHTVARLLMAKSFGASQVCICPDYLLVTPKAKSALIAELNKQIPSLPDLKTADTYGKIVHEGAFDRLAGLLSASKGTIVAKSEGQLDRATRFFPIHVVECPDVADPLMEDEMFGPIYPLHEVGDIDEAIDIIHGKEKPLAAYIFTGEKAVAEKFVERTWTGGVTVNDVMAHCSTMEAPFGGVGSSGIGRIMGKYGFDAFTHEKAVAVRKGLKAHF